MRSKVNFEHPKWPTGTILSKLSKKSCVSILNAQKCDQNLFFDIQNVRRQPLCQQFQTKIKVAYRSEIARNAIKSEILTSKMGAGCHFVKRNLKKSWVSIWNDQKCDKDFQNGRRQPFCKKNHKIKIMGRQVSSCYFVQKFELLCTKCIFHLLFGTKFNF